MKPLLKIRKSTVVVPLLIGLLVLCGFILCRVCTFLDTPPFTVPDNEVTEEDIIGTWTVEYGEGREKITFFPEGKYQQVYEDNKQNYFYTSNIYNWYIEITEEGLYYLHLEGGRYYLAGISYFENDGWGRSFYDPFAKKIIQPDNELILVVVNDKSKNLILHQLWTSPDRGFPILDKDEEYFKRD